MIEQLSLHSQITMEDGQFLWCSYRLLCEPDPETGDPVYGIDCALEGVDNSELPLHHAVVRGISPHQKPVENLLWRLARGQALPVHIRDIVSDFLG